MRLIDADAIPYQSEIIADESGYMAEFDIAYKSDIDRQPTVEVEKVAHAHWIVPEFQNEIYSASCSKCGRFCMVEHDYKGRPRYYDRCPCCGAVMDEEVAHG